jgi:hypothetical protein
VGPFRNQLARALPLRVSRLKREVAINVKVGLLALMQEELVELVKADVFEVAPWIRGIGGK